MGTFKTGKKATSTSKDLDAKTVAKNIAVDTFSAVSTVTLPTRDAIKAEEPATPVSEGTVDHATISPPSVPKGMKELFT
ncbi:hypothetical protein NLG97_g11397 [Lecanicillium saksenae]|uniref:Uncharacterized protein n=1 Tax=Lecanicillium saksenae TaxID=468837 RepID=A0ACC1QAF6_9HYPO|nr:hypothetical protein NLG97_g11397 [Lecanicillium saksenae]